MKEKVALLCITLIAAFLHYSNLTPYTLYPDSYQNILVAENIHTYKSVIGTLGKDGQIWPEYFGWTRPGYALLILAANSFFNNYFTAAKTVTLIAVMIAVPFAYFFILQVTESKKLAIGGMVLLALSANYAEWSGLILTEGVGILALMLALSGFFYVLKKESQPAEIRDLILGCIIALAF
ncbi:MAG: hypothetical protein M3Q44_07465 [bacterium]|nr:hypothetical protein [bacterium]